MLVEWDAAKAAENRRKHGVDFADAVPVLNDPFALSREDVRSAGERRFVALGLDRLGRILVVAYTYRGGRTHLISARRATRKERGEYERRRA